MGDCAETGSVTVVELLGVCACAAMCVLYCEISSVLCCRLYAIV